MSTQLPSLSFQHVAAELRLYCGADSLASLARELKRNGCQRAVVVGGRSISGSSAMAQLRSTLGPVLAGESQAVRPNSPVPSVEEVARMLGDLGADAVIAVGGGSAVVTARAASILLAEKRPAQALCTRRLPSGDFESPRLSAPKLPQFVIPTTPSNAFVKVGSAVHDSETHQRLALYDPKTRAKAIFLHPEFLRSAPETLVRDASLNTLSTAIEGLESSHCDPVSEAMLLQSLHLVVRHLGHMKPDEIAAREYLAVAGVLCGRGTEQSGGGLASVLAHAIGHRVSASNGIVNAVVLPHTLRYGALVTQQVTGRIVDCLRRSITAGSYSDDAGSPDSLSLAANATPRLAAGRSNTAAEVLESVLATLAIPRRLRDIGVRQDDLDPIARAAMSDWFIGRSPRRVADASELMTILEAAW